MIHNKLLINSDGNKIEYVKTITHDNKGQKLKEFILEYIYTYSSSKLGMILPITQVDIETKIKNEIFKPI
tara:strand:+ start:200 stop:409 length:210 start_codon:yes stop_codon:yes gene_type:complete